MGDAMFDNGIDFDVEALADSRGFCYGIGDGSEAVFM